MTDHGSKKKNRKASLMIREAKRNERKLFLINLNKAKTIEEMAKVMGVKLK